MKTKLIYWLAIGVFFCFVGCIDDTSQMGGRPLSNITIESAQDTFYFEFGDEIRIEPLVKQDIEEKELHYEWRYQYLKSGETDSLKYLPCKDAVLSDFVNFRNLGEYKVRLRAYNDDGSSFYYYTVYVRSTYDKGLLVLSKDEDNKGRLSFLRVKNEGEVLTSDIDGFKTNVFAEVNPGISLDDPTDMMFWKNQKMILISLADNMIQFCDQSIGYLYPMTWQDPLTLGAVFGSQGDTKYLFTKNKGVFSLEPDAIYPSTWTTSSITKVCQCPTNVMIFTECCYFIDFENSKIYVDRGKDTGTKFANRDIVNIGANDNYVLILSAEKNNPKKLLISFYQTTTLNTTGLDDYAYEASELTLTKDMDILSENKYTKTAYYFKGSALYRWALSGNMPKLPTEPITTVENEIKKAGGEITTLALSPNFKNLYIGVYSPDSSKALKGSVWVMDIETMKIVKKYDGIADRPVKIVYKENK